ncbi:ribosome small subunit-dependent GTPase A [Aeromicrobium sp. PE09-221]|uniref:ribosome small subunit-dependent GTPase A n=1 Tax=Aeromicrobium sp. PE09-221 TaxID=1898043 RepID=UPI000B75793D|nr:ribosome small subunit-dependent GTPase A [Aeromicrobium sp. PE09-221]OUZ11224.1 ribosome small subunit-dependent GTPase A [Aeromicrobium sp. PE09-221]
MTRRERDEHEAYDRPRRRGSRPRTKERPDYDDAAVAQVVTIDRGRYTLDLDGSPVTAMKSRPLGRQGVVVGDEVRVVGDLSGRDGTLARIVEVLPRRTVLRRTADDDEALERVIVANADQLVIVQALADPPPRAGLIDRCLVAAYDAGIEPLVCFTKADLGSPEEMLALLDPLDVRVVVTRRGGDLDELRTLLRDRMSVLVGHSGVGKSTLVNALVPQADRATSHVNEVTGRGRHTSTSAQLLRLPFPGSIIDTPGIRSFGLRHVETDHIIRAFDDLDAVARDCPRGCTHLTEEPECALDAAIAAGELPRARVESFRRILSSRSLATDY